jgi:hypothetical protein
MSRHRVLAMTSFTFRCPNTGLLVQGWAAAPTVAGRYYEAVDCTACKHMHFVDPRTGDVMARDRQKPSAH